MMRRDIGVRGRVPLARADDAGAVSVGRGPRQSAPLFSADWRYLATAGTQHIDAIGADVPGLALPQDAIDKIYYRNARRVFKLTN